MFKKLKKDRSNILLLFLLEVILAAGFLVCFIVLDHIGFIKTYGTYILIAYFVLINIFNIHVITRLLKKSEKYLNRTDITIASIFGNEASPVFEFGNIVILVYNEADEIIWVSQTTLLKKSDCLGQKTYDLIPDIENLIVKQNTQEIYTNLSGKTFQIEINTGLKVIYLKDVSAQVIQNEKVEDERPFIGHIVIDNYQDVIISLGEADFVIYVTEVKELIMAWAKRYNLFVRSYGNDSFLIVGEEKNYQEMVADNFSLIDEIRELTEKSDNPLTVSIGIGKGNTSSILRTSELSYMALNMALSRGGDQVVVNVFGKPLEYYGAKNEVKQTRSHVRGRVLATSLANLIKSNKEVIIMGHKNMDFDALGACLGVLEICRSLKVKSHFVYEDSLVEQQTKQAFRQVFSINEINEMTITPAKALQVASEQTLVIVVDTHKADSTMQPKVLEKCKEVCVIDHHRKGDTFINDPVFQYHEPQSSSASELVTELIYYQPNKIQLSEDVANFLLSGICLDTKFFRSGASSKTFEMAMILKGYQATVEAVSDFFKEDINQKKLITSIVNSASTIVTGVYVAVAEDDNNFYTRTSLSKAADEILSIKEVQAVFVLGRTNHNEVSISARSLSDFNVQIIMESYGGGGHFSKAAAQLTNYTLEEAVASLKDRVKVFLRDNGRL